MQRLNAIMSFIEQEFDIGGFYFDLETMVETKLLSDTDVLHQKSPKLERTVCSKFASYMLPLSVYKIEDDGNIDIIFRRINSGGQTLSRQEIRQSGSTGNFAGLVRDISARIRGDVSALDKLLLNNMREISITNRDLPYGINVDNIFWVKQRIIRREKVRESRDEEIISDMLAYMLLDPKPPSSSEALDSYYGLFDSPFEEERYSKLETELVKRTPEIVTSQFLIVFDQLKKTLEAGSKPFNTLMFPGAGSNVPRYFQCIFLALYNQLIEKGKVIKSYTEFVSKLDGIGKYMNITDGGNWSATDRQKNIESVEGIISSEFRKRGPEDPALDSWTTQLENILMQSFTEQALYDFKQGFHRLDRVGNFDKSLYSKIIRTLTAMANYEPGATGYVLVGIADDKSDADRAVSIYSLAPTTFSKFYITGVQSEANKYHTDIDKYFQYILQNLKNEPISSSLRDQIAKDIRLIRYYDKAVLVFRVTGGKSPTMYDKKYFVRKGPNTEEVLPDDYEELFRRFIS